jgi:hypothetical protein
MVSVNFDKLRARLSNAETAMGTIALSKKIIFPAIMK